MQQDKNVIRVSFKDYSFFVPKDIGGQQVTLAGVLVEKELSPEQADHYSKDLGEDNSVQSGRTYEIVATSVRIPKENSTLN